MLSKHKISFIRSLQIPKFREQHQTFIAEGPKVVNELLKSSFSARDIFAVQEWDGIHQRPDITSIVTGDELKKISRLQTPNQVLALVRIPETVAFPAALPALTPLLDGIRDPGNLGTIIRVCDWFGIGHIVCSSDTADLYNPKVVQASMGSVFRVRVHYTDPASFLKSNAGKATVFGAYPDGVPVWKSRIEKPAILVIGNESNGITPVLSALIGQRISIPALTHADGRNGAESLNASVAAAILINEFCRSGFYSR